MMPNLDTMSAEELHAFWDKYQRPTRVNAAALVGKIRGYVTLTKDLAHYAINRATSLECRARGDTESAQIYERVADNIYQRIPPRCGWK